MKNLFTLKNLFLVLFFLFLGFIAYSTGTVYAQTAPIPTISLTADQASLPFCQQLDTGELGFKIPSLGDILTFVIRAFFVIAGLVALVYMLLGALAWITSGGDKDSIGAARDKIQAAVIGMIMIVVVLAIIWTLETIVFKRRICIGISCPVTIPGLIETTQNANECVCINDDGAPVGVIDIGGGGKCPNS